MQHLTVIPDKIKQRLITGVRKNLVFNTIKTRESLYVEYFTFLL